MKENANLTTPTLSEITDNIARTVNSTLSTISEIQVDLKKPDIFLNDTLNNFFIHYEECGTKNNELLVLMWYAAQRHQVYLESAIGYIRNALEKLDIIHDNLQTLYSSLRGGKHLENV